MYCYFWGRTQWTATCFCCGEVFVWPLQFHLCCAIEHWTDGFGTLFWYSMNELVCWYNVLQRRFWPCFIIYLFHSLFFSFSCPHRFVFLWVKKFPVSRGFIVLLPFPLHLFLLFSFVLRLRTETVEKLFLVLRQRDMCDIVESVCVQEACLETSSDWALEDWASWRRVVVTNALGMRAAVETTLFQPEMSNGQEWAVPPQATTDDPQKR